ncbi:MAG: Rieske (2Fe-2S) protein, partial [Proteobacteria bacterium]|nr:Rieske (2Fe-2S) protein [Pseudomonadota bacterium]
MKISTAALEPLAPDPAPHALPAWVYSHPEMTRLEIQRILLPSWQIVTHVSALKKSGDFATLDLGPESVFVIRDRDGVIRGFHNVCRHRGARLVDGQGTCPTSVTCPYHGWSYRHDGSLMGMPVR